MNSLPSVSGLTLTGDYALAAVPARYTMELGTWEEASELKAQAPCLGHKRLRGWRWVWAARGGQFGTGEPS